MIKEKNFLSAVIYVHNDEKYIADFVSRLAKLLSDNFEHSEMICVNDSSSDCSVEKIKAAEISVQNVALSVLNMSFFHGTEVAMNAGVDLAIGDFVLEIDCAQQDYAMEEIMRTYRKVLTGFDIVSAYPDKKQRISSRLFYSVYERFSDEHLKMRSETFRILSRRAINRINSMSKTIPYRKGLYANCGLKTAQLCYQVVGTVSQETSKKIRKYRNRLALDSILLFTNAGYSFSKLMTATMMFASLFMIVYTLAVYILGQPVAGWTTTVLFLAVAFFGLFGILTIIIKYLQMLLDLTFKRAKYSFESIEKLTK